MWRPRMWSHLLLKGIGLISGGLIRRRSHRFLKGRGLTSHGSSWSWSHRWWCLKHCSHKSQSLRRLCCLLPRIPRSHKALAAGLTGCGLIGYRLICGGLIGRGLIGCSLIGGGLTGGGLLGYRIRNINDSCLLQPPPAPLMLLASNVLFTAPLQAQRAPRVGVFCIVLLSDDALFRFDDFIRPCRPS